MTEKMFLFKILMKIDFRGRILIFLHGHLHGHLHGQPSRTPIHQILNVFVSRKALKVEILRSKINFRQMFFCFPNHHKTALRHKKNISILKMFHTILESFFRFFDRFKFRSKMNDFAFHIKSSPSPLCNLLG
jgi:hypothetical protein